MVCVVAQVLGRIGGSSKLSRLGLRGLQARPIYGGTDDDSGSSRGQALKFNIEVECTPDEARRLLGLPEVAAMQERLIEEMEVQLKDTIRTMDGKAMLEQWLPVGLKGVEQAQSFWTQLAAAAAGVQRNRKDRTPGKADNDDKS